MDAKWLNPASRRTMRSSNRSYNNKANSPCPLVQRMIHNPSGCRRKEQGDSSHKE
jgi:hypothetical protein